MPFSNILTCTFCNLTIIWETNHRIDGLQMKIMLSCSPPKYAIRCRGNILWPIKLYNDDTSTAVCILITTKERCFYFPYTINVAMLLCHGQWKGRRRRCGIILHSVVYTPYSHGVSLNYRVPIHLHLCLGVTVLICRKKDSAFKHNHILLKLFIGTDAL